LTNSELSQLRKKSPVAFAGRFLENEVSAVKMHDAVFEAETPSVLHSLDFVILTDYLVI
jgi:hypothetical protein